MLVHLLVSFCKYWDLNHTTVVARDETLFPEKKKKQKHIFSLDLSSVVSQLADDSLAQCGSVLSKVNTLCESL